MSHDSKPFDPEEMSSFFLLLALAQVPTAVPKGEEPLVDVEPLRPFNRHSICNHRQLRKGEGVPGRKMSAS